MKTTLLILMALLTLALAALGDVVSATTTNQVVAFTNSQRNALWTPTALIVTVPSPTNFTLHIFRHGQGGVVLLARKDVVDTGTLIWAPDAEYRFPQSSALEVVATTSNFTAQLHRRPAL
ncbi:MAG TPA: hypothetical protein PKE12_11195 [Kiritimatiellia bacterium]|nr:hypothetical protein [Kiritimatiellia bacterium]